MGGWRIILAAMAMISFARANPVVFSGVGGNNASLTTGSANAAMNSFKAAIGGNNNGANPPATSGFRTITWDGVFPPYDAPGLLPANYFNTTSPRGVVLVAPSAGVQVSARSGGATPTNFGNINPSYATHFVAFSPGQLFTPIDTNVVVIYFYAPGTNHPAFVRGFGAVFDDVQFPNTTLIQYFGLDGTLLDNFFAPIGSSGEAEFFGAVYAPADPPIGHVVVTLGNAALSSTTVDGSSTDVVVMDDIVYSEPISDEIFRDGFD